MKKVFIVLVALFCLVGMTNAQSKLGLSVQGAVSLPMGDFGDLAQTGFGGLGTVTYNLSKNLDLTGTVGYLTFSHKEVTFFGGTITGSTSLIPIYGGIRYYFAAKDFKPYVMAAAGFVSATIKAEGSGFGITTSNSTSKSYTGFLGGAGFLYKIGNKMNLDVNASYNAVSDINFVSVAAGVHFAF